MSTPTRLAVPLVALLALLPSVAASPPRVDDDIVGSWVFETPIPGQVELAQVQLEVEPDAGLTTYATLESLEAELEQVKAYPQLGLTDPPENGVLYVKRKAGDDLSVRLEMQKPEHRIVTVKDGHLVIDGVEAKAAE